MLMSNSNAVIKDSIFATIGDKAIARSDIINEIKIILILNETGYSEEIKKQLDNSAIASIIKRTIKKIEIEKYPNLTFNESDLRGQINQLAANLNMNLDMLKETFETNGINFLDIVDQIKTDLLWNSLIFSIYKDRLSINSEEIDEQLKMIDKKEETFEYLISEIIIKPVNKDNLNLAIEEIINEINTKGFEKVAIEKSISETAIKGGDLGWLNEKSISKQFKNNIANTLVGKISKPILLPQGILFFKVRDKRKVAKYVNLEDAKNQLVRAEKNKILNMYSLSHYDNLRRTISIVYY